MSKIGLIQFLFKGTSFYLPKENSNSVLKDLIIEFSKQKNLIKHYFIYLDNRFECRFRFFVHSNLTSEEVEKLIKNILEPYIVQNQTFDSPKQLFKTFNPYTIVPIAYIQYSDEIYVFLKDIESSGDYLTNLTNLIAEKSEEIDFEDINQKLEFTLELLLSSIDTCGISSKSLTQLYKSSWKNDSAYKDYLENHYAQVIEQNRESIMLFRKSLLLKENAENLFAIFWKKNGLNNYKLAIELIFKVLNTSSKSQIYCLYILHKNSEKLDSN